MNINTASNSIFNTPQINQIVAQSNRGAVSARLLTHHINRTVSNVSPVTEEMLQNIHFLRHQNHITQPQNRAALVTSALSYTRDELRGLRQLLVYSQGEHISDVDRLTLYQEAADRTQHIRDIPLTFNLSSSRFFATIGGTLRDFLESTVNIVDTTLESATYEERNFSPQEIEEMSTAIYTAIAGIVGMARGIGEERTISANPYATPLQPPNDTLITSDLVSNVLSTDIQRQLTQNLQQTLLQSELDTSTQDDNEQQNSTVD